MRHRARLVLVAILSASLGVAQDDPILTHRAVESSRLSIAPDGVTPAEEIVLATDLPIALSTVGLEESVWLLDWPLSPGVRRDVRLTRKDVYAPDARVIVVEDGREREVPRSGLRFFFGQTEVDELNRVVVVLDPDRSLLQGHYLSIAGWVDLQAKGEGSEDYLLAPSTAFTEAETVPLDFECATGMLPEVQPQSVDSSNFAPTGAPAGTLRRATAAVDTDNELMLIKFADSTSAATNYIANLFALMTVIYERDLDVRLLQGTTFLRVSTTLDPYFQTTAGNANSAQLQEFANYWDANYGNVPRAVAMMLSGKQLVPTSTSGIAYVDTLCDPQFGYSFTQVYKFSMNTASSDTSTVAHENGHNFGSKHTHCYLNPTPIDTCNNQESGCYSGPTSCPAPTTINGVTNVRGTLMSYCHRLSGCSLSNVFHPRTVSLLAPIIESHENQCIFLLANPKEASPADDLRVDRVSASSVEVTYEPACGATDHTLYVGDLTTLRTSGIAWTERECALGTSGAVVANLGTTNAYFVVVGNNGSLEGSYGQGTTGERPPAGPGPGCQYTQDLSGTCP